jgi:hypothetical protein
MPRWTRNRVEEMQIWPVPRNRLAAPPAAAASRSASAKTRTGPWPPSSSVIGLAPAAARPASDLDRTGKRHLADDRRCDELRGHGVRHAEHDLQHAFRQARVVQSARQSQCRGRTLLARLDDHAAAGSQRGGQLACRCDRREVPWRESGHRTDRLALDELQHTGTVGGDDPSVDAPGFFGKPLEIIGGAQHLVAAFQQRLAFLQRHHGGDMFGPIAYQAGSGLHDGGAFGRYGTAPNGKGTLAGGKGALEVALVGQGKAAEHGAAGRVDDRRAVAPAGVGVGGEPLPVDEQVQPVIR